MNRDRTRLKQLVPAYIRVIFSSCHPSLPYKLPLISITSRSLYFYLAVPLCQQQSEIGGSLLTKPLPPQPDNKNKNQHNR